MLPQNGHQNDGQHNKSQPGMPPYNSGFDSSSGSSFFNMDPSQAAKQIAALNAASQLRMANTRAAAPSTPLSTGGTSSGSYLGGTVANSSHDVGVHLPPNQGHNPAFLDPSMSQSRQGPPLQHRQQGFLNGLATVMIKRGTPLPPALTGFPAPNYDPSTTTFSAVEPSAEPGAFRLLGKDIDLFKLWGLVFQHGGASALKSNNGWSAVLAQFGLPEESPHPLPNGGTSVAQMLQVFYAGILLPFEEMYRKNVQEQAKKAQMASRQLGAPNETPTTPSRPTGLQPSLSGGQLSRGSVTGIAGGPAQPSTTNGTSSPMFSSPPTHQRRPSSSASSAQQPGQNTPQNFNVTSSELPQQSDSNDPDNNGLKRKSDSEDAEGKRTKQKTDSEPPEASASAPVGNDRTSVASANSGPSSAQTQTLMTGPTRTRQQPSRRKIEYVPVAREVDTYGGRDLRQIEGEMAARRPIRDVSEWGNVDIDSLMMSIRSRLSTEMAYALTTFTLLSTMKGQTPGSGFPIFQCVDLLEEVLDLLEEQAFDGVDDTFDIDIDSHVTTNRELMNAISEAEYEPFSVLAPRQGSKNPSLGPKQRPGNLVLAVLNIIRNLSVIADNVDFLARHQRLVELLLRVCAVTPKAYPPSPSSPALSLVDIVTVRKDTLYILCSLSSSLHLPDASPPTKATTRMTNRVFQLIVSYLVDPSEAVSPFACVQTAAVTHIGHVKPPSLADIALDVFTRLSQSDENRQVLAKAIPRESLMRLFVSLVHRLPVLDADFQLIMREQWLSYLEKTIMAIYSLAFFAPPDLKNKVKSDRSLGFKGVMLRMVHKFLMNQESRVWFMVCTRRAIEAMKVLDDAEDSFDSSKSAVPTMSFGMGFGEVGDNGLDKGTGLLGGHRELAWDMLMVREVFADEVLFRELESLARVE